ncbi:ImmA/IrrE family metallo-endopeptidase [Bradyrhizobium yuanmingense]|uniref:ImmA/IrrE family metallo-endopeptidase n=1 Tax=Bradyrhizobium yuanmingense TaxID=108015 RepID=UPI001CD27115|nr:ImmA/IrrE family metallo-endopeptidase [Bradyrhizobium yuanmingense]MCA1529938.1 ImmA/IrrE family metallo-endopeptidase [Bradyrhizobium yuanmingense]
MSVTRTTKLSFNRRALATEAMQAAAATRAKAKLDQAGPICIYGLCETLGVVVRFNNINMEGMYQRGLPPRIHLSARRPLPRRVYNCAHELGHHVFGHGSSIDELREDAKAHPWDDPKEFLADTFAGFALMPIIGLRRAFAVRRWAPETAAPAQIFTIACEFGVGYATLLTHLSAGVNMLSRARAAALQRVTPKDLRTDILGTLTPDPLIVADRHRTAPTLDAEVKTLLLLPSGAEIAGDGLAFERDLAAGRLFRAVKPGIFQATAGDWAVFVRIAPVQKNEPKYGYIGLAQYRHLEEDLDE